MFLSVLSRVVRLNLVLDELQELLKHADLPEEALRRLRDRLDPDTFDGAPARAARSELAFSAGAIEHLAQEYDPSDKAPTGVWSIDAPILKRDAALLLGDRARAVRILEGPFLEAGPRLRALDAEVAARKEFLHPLSSSWVWTPTLEAVTKTKARLTLARAATDLELERRRTGARPAALADPPLDPFTGGPIQYDPVAGELSAQGGVLRWTLRAP